MAVFKYQPTIKTITIIKTTKKKMKTKANNTKQFKDVEGTVFTLDQLKKITTKNHWFEIEGYPNYLISQRGVLKSLERVIQVGDSKPYVHEERVWKGKIDREGYYKTTLIGDNEKRAIRIHQLMAIVFLNHIPNGNKRVCDHINNIKTDNHISNIQVISHRENISKDLKNKTSEYTGVNWSKKGNAWESSIGMGGNRYFLGYFQEELEAYHEYQRALKDWEVFRINPRQRKEIESLTVYL